VSEEKSMRVTPRSANLAVAVAMALFWVGSATAQEQRCNALGSACTCSEPLNVNGFTTSGTFADPSDTNSKGCFGGKALFFESTADLAGLVPTAETGMPAGNTVSYVFRNNRPWDRNMLGVGSSATINSSTRRICYRYYARMSPDYDGGTGSDSPNCAVGKQMSFWFNNGDQIIVTDAGTKNRTTPFRLAAQWGNFQANNGNTPYIPVAEGSNALKWAECYGQWCQMEVCLSGNFATNTGDFFVEGYHRRLSDNKRTTWPRTNIGPRRSGATNVLSGAWLHEPYRGNSGPGACANGGTVSSYTSWREASHLMEAQWTTDTPGLFIGPAVEIEGTSGSPPPPSEPPPEPDSLGKPGTPTYQAP
jgi:hypothetical protein